MNEQELERLAGKLGVEAAESLAPERIAARVLARLEDPPVLELPPRRRVVPWALGLAAAALLVLTFRMVLPELRSAGPARGQQTVLHELDQLNADQLEQILETMPATGNGVAPESAPLETLDSIKLERLLRSLEG